MLCLMQIKVLGRVFDNVTEENGQYYVGRRKVLAEIVGKPYSYNTSRQPDWKMDDDGQLIDTACLTPRDLVHMIVCKIVGEQGEEIGRANGFKVHGIRREIASTGILTNNDYVALGTDYLATLQFCRYHYIYSRKKKKKRG